MLLRHLALLMVLGCAGPRPAPAPEATPRTPEATPAITTLRVPLASEPHAADPHRHVAHGPTRTLIALIHTGLQTMDGERVAPGLADVSTADGVRWTIRLRADASFHDGRPVSSDDVVRSLDRARSDEVDEPARARTLLRRLVGLERVDPRTVHATLASPDYTFPHTLAHPLTYVVHPDDPTIGTGPYRLSERSDALVVLRAAGDAAVDRVELRWDLSRADAIEAFRRGELDLVHGLDRETFEGLANDPELAERRHVAPTLQVWGVAFRTDRPPYDAVEVRRAIARAVCPDALQVPGRPPLTRLYPPRLSMGESSGVACDPEAARATFEALDAPLPIAMARGTEVYGEHLERSLAAAGAQVELRYVPYGEYLSQARAGALPAFMWGWDPYLAHPVDYAERLFASDGVGSERFVHENLSAHRDPTLDAQLQEARAEPDEARRRARYLEAEARILDQAPWAFLVGKDRLELVQPWVHDYVGGHGEGEAYRRLRLSPRAR